MSGSSASVCGFPLPGGTKCVRAKAHIGMHTSEWRPVESSETAPLVTVRAGDRLRQFAQAATPGPWRYEDMEGRLKQADARLIALAPDLAVLVADLADALEELQAMAHPITSDDHDYVNDVLPALLARVVALADPGDRQ